MSGMSVIGINVGNENSYIAVARSGGIEILANEYSHRHTPTYVAFKENVREIGTAAKSNHIVNLKGTLFCFKRLLATKYKDGATLHMEKSFLPYDLCEMENGDVGFKATYRGVTKEFASQQVTAMMITKLKLNSQLAIKNNVTDCVIGVPTYFTDAERRAMVEACLIAGIRPITLISEATATALFYGFYKYQNGNDSLSKVVIFIDIGYTSLQISACNFDKDGGRVLAMVWDKNLGGRNFDIALLNYFCGELKRNYSMDIRSNPKAMTRLLKECEKVKKQMSTNSHDIPVHIECFHEDQDFNSSIRREHFEHLISLHLEILEINLHKIYKEAKIQMQDIHAVELIGGSTRIPAIKQVIKKVFKKDPRTTLNQDETIVQGCALMGAMLSPTIKVKPFNINDVQPYDICLYWKLQNGEEGYLEIFDRYSAIPNFKIISFENCQPFILELYYSNKDRQSRHAKPVVSYQCSNFSLASDMKNPMMAVKLSIDHNGIFGVEGRALENLLEGRHHIPLTPQNALYMISKEATQEQEMNAMDQAFKTGKEIIIECYFPHLSKHDMERYIQEEKEMISHDNFEKEKMDAKNSLEEYIYEVRDKLSGRLGSFMSLKDRQILESKLIETESWLYQEGHNQPKQIYSTKMEELRKYSLPPLRRLFEYERRPEAFKEMSSLIQATAKGIEHYSSSSNTGVKPETILKIKKWLDEKRRWLDQFIEATSKLSPYEDPPFSISQIAQEKEIFEKTILPTLVQLRPLPPPVKGQEEGGGGGGGGTNGASHPGMNNPQ